MGISNRGCLRRNISGFAHWDDARQLRWGPDYFVITAVHVRFYLEHRKNAQHSGNFVDVAIPESGERGAYHVVREAFLLFRSGYVLPHIDASEHSRRFAGQSARAGAVTTAARAGMQPYELRRLAGVTPISWCLAYTRPDFNDTRAPTSTTVFGLPEQSVYEPNIILSGHHIEWVGLH